MKKDKILIVTNALDDLHADALIERCNDMGIGDRIIRLNTESFVENCIIKFDIDNYKVEIKDSERFFFIDEIHSVWYRRPLPIKIEKLMDHDAGSFIAEQATAAIRGLYFLTHNTAKWVNPLTSLHMARQKLPQLALAKSVGFNVPNTIVTNCADEALRFFDKFKIVCNKSLDSPNYVLNGEIYPYFTRKIENRSDIENNIQSINICPTLFQEYIKKQADIRVVVIGNDVTAVRIDSQCNMYSEVDFRGASPHLLKHTKWGLPASVERSVLDFVHKSKLRFSSMDLVLDESGKYYFIENNCNGQWLWLDGLAETNLLDKMISYLNA